MVGQRIGSAIIRSRKTKIVCTRVYFWRRFSPFLGNSRADDHPPTEKPVEGNDTYLNPGRKVRTVAPANQQLGLRYERIKNVWAWLWVGQWAWPGGM